MTTLLHDWVTSHAESCPEASALILKEEKTSYGQLEQASNQLARLLKEAGCRKGDRICFLLPKSPTAVLTMIGIMKADCVYVPLDPGSPAPRLARIIETCEPRWILAGGPVAGLLLELSSTTANLKKPFQVGWMETDTVQDARFSVDFTLNDLHSFPETPPHYENLPSDPVYILFTSGSTGAPKGVVITHSNVIHFVEWANRYFEVESSDRLSGHSPFHFDLSTYDIFGALAAGAQLHLVPPELNVLPNKVADFIRSSELTQWFSVPSILTYMDKFDVITFNDFPALKRLLWCGEVFPTRPLINWMERLPHVTFTNLYGPTETTIASSYYTVPQCPNDLGTSIPIGKACEGEALLVLDDNLGPISPGQIGDLYISGIGLSPGYWRDAEKTRAAFLPHPNGSDPENRIYRTGDLASVGEDGLVYFHGRADFQIKSRGYRIELGEIESALSGLNELQACAVVALETGSFEGTTICCAYEPAPNSEVAPVELRKTLSKVLPNYMLPTRWMAQDSLPLNPNGKVDRPKIKELFLSEKTGPSPEFGK